MIADQYRSIDAILLGRTRYEIWAAFWPTMPPDDVFAKVTNETPKYVVSRILKIANWQILGADWAERVADLKTHDGKGILVSGTDLAFAPLGAVSLRGIPGQWELFEVSTSAPALEYSQTSEVSRARAPAMPRVAAEASRAPG
ncbi:MAG: hypothetical protein ACR2H0_00560 [Candidatus Limnocylindrales bacterium]